MLLSADCRWKSSQHGRHRGGFYEKPVTDSGHLPLNHVKTGRVWRCVINHVSPVVTFSTDWNIVRKKTGTTLFIWVTLISLASGANMCACEWHMNYDNNDLIINHRVFFLLLLQRLKIQSTKYRTGNTYSSKTADKQENAKRNRYKDIVPCKFHSIFTQFLQQMTHHYTN